MIDLDGKTFMKDEIHEMIRSSRRLSAPGATIYVTAIFGGHLCKADLLNHLFGCCFVGMDGSEHQYNKDLKEKIMWASECSVPNLLVVFQGEPSFERTNILFALTILSVMIFNIDAPGLIGRQDQEVLFTIFKERLKLGQERKIMLLVVIHGYDSQDCPFQQVEKEMIDLMTLMWDRVANPTMYRHTSYLHFFDCIEVTIRALPGKEREPEKFENEVAQLRKWFGTKQFDGFQNYKIAATGFSYSTEILWKKIIEDTKLDLPAHMDMVSCYLCDEAKKQCLTMLNSDEDFLSLTRTESPQEFSDKLESLLGRLINRYKVETETCSEEVRNKMENELIDDIIRDTSTYSEKLVTELQSKMYDSSVQRILSATEAGPYFDVHGLVESCLNEFTNACEVLLPRYPTILSEIINAIESDLFAYDEKVQSMQIKMMEKTLEKERSEPENVQLSMAPLNLEGANITTEREDAFKKFELSRLKNYIEFSRWELEKATNKFNNSSMIGEGGFGIVYKGFLRNTTVAIKVPKPGTCQGDEFNQKVEILSKVRHPNLISFLGANTEAQTLVFEFLPNGSLDSYLAKGENSSRKLFWQDRICIASEICSALIFLHSIKPHGIAHGDLKPENILLDSNLVSKITDFGISRELQQSTKTITPFNFTQNPKGSMGYIDPEYFFCGELTPQSDVFAFGIILLQLVTDRKLIGLIRIVEDALDKHKFDSIVYDSGDEFPIQDAKKLVSLGFLCSDRERTKRPDSEKYVLPSIESMKRRVAGSHAMTIQIQVINHDIDSEAKSLGSLPQFFDL